MTKVFILLVVLFVVLAACDKTDTAPNGYSFYLSFVDNEGNDLVEGIETTLDDTGSPIVQKDKYTYKFLDSKDNSSKRHFIRLENVDGYNALYITEILWDGSSEDIDKALTHKLFCPYIFGDEKAHTIIAHWKFSNQDKRICLVRLTLDGVNARIVESKDRYNPLVIVTLNK